MKRTKPRRAIYLVALMGLLSIASAHVMINLRADVWLSGTVAHLVDHRVSENLSSINVATYRVTNRSAHPQVRALWISSGLGEPSEKLRMEKSDHRAWGYAWVAAQQKQAIFQTKRHYYLMSGSEASVLIDRIDISAIPRPQLTIMSYLAAFLTLLIWGLMVRLRRGSSPVLLGGLLFGVVWIGALFWSIHSAESARQLLYESASHPDTLGDFSLIFSAALLPIVVAVVFGMIRKGEGSMHREAYTYLTPAVVGMLVLVFIPFLLGIALAFTRYQEGDYTWVGLANFVSILSNEGLSISHPLSFYFTLGVTILWTAVNVFFHASIGLLLALLLNRPDFKFKAVYRVLLIIPWAVPSYITALVWHGMFDSTDGLINACISAVGLAKIPWFDHFWSGFSANVITNTWLGFPFMMVVSLGALQSIPKDLYEAAEVDGATRWQAFWRITVPMLRPALMPAIILGAVWTFNMFNVIYLVSGGAPSNSTDILITEAYRWAFEKDRYGYAAAYSLIIFFILLLYSFVTSKLSRSEEAIA